MSIQTEKQKIGQIGEDIASKFLVKHGFEVIQRNYRKVFGEIDIICQKNFKFHFVEVKTVSRKTQISNFDSHRPEDNVSEKKLIRIGRTVQSYIFEHNLNNEWQFDVITVCLDHECKTANVSVMNDIII